MIVVVFRSKVTLEVSLKDLHERLEAVCDDFKDMLDLKFLS